MSNDDFFKTATMEEHMEMTALAVEMFSADMHQTAPSQQGDGSNREYLERRWCDAEPEGDGSADDKVLKVVSWQRALNMMLVRRRVDLRRWEGEVG